MKPDPIAAVNVVAMMVAQPHRVRSHFVEKGIVSIYDGALQIMVRNVREAETDIDRQCTVDWMRETLGEFEPHPYGPCPYCGASQTNLRRLFQWGGEVAFQCTKCMRTLTCRHPPQFVLRCGRCKRGHERLAYYLGMEFEGPCDGCGRASRCRAYIGNGEVPRARVVRPPWWRRLASVFAAP